MFTLELHSTEYVPPGHEITLRTELDDRYHHDIDGLHEDGTWRFQLAEERYRGSDEGSFRFEFVLNRACPLGRLQISPAPESTYTYDLTRSEIRTGPARETGQVQSRWFPSISPNGQVYDVVIVGSGVGGGVLADQLSHAGMSVMLLEAGGYLFPTHAANLPRRQLLGRLNKAFWQTWEDFSTYNYWNSPSSEYRGAQGYNLGGRSVFWGGFIPRMTSWEADFWPRDIKWYLEDFGYELAEAMTGRSVAPRTLYNQEMHNYLLHNFPRFHHIDAPVAVQNSYEGMNTIAPGMFSTADLLTESYLTQSGRGGTRGKNLTINLNHEVTAVHPGDGEVVVEAKDLQMGRTVRFQARRAILCAGTLESARLAYRSKFPDPNGLIGRGLTDHPIYYNHFEIPRDSRFYNALGNIKILSQPREPESKGEAEQNCQFNVHFELGSDFNQGRYLDFDLLEEHLERRRGLMLGELVFLFHAELLESNYLEFIDEQQGRPRVHMGRHPLADELTAQMLQYKEKVYTDLGVENEIGSGAADLGGVAHEVGTLRMEVKDSNRVGDARSRPRAGLVDNNCKFIGLENVYVCDLSVFPTSPAANPTLTLVALAIRLARHLQAK